MTEKGRRPIGGPSHFCMHLIANIDLIGFLALTS